MRHDYAPDARARWQFHARSRCRSCLALLVTAARRCLAFVLWRPAIDQRPERQIAARRARHQARTDRIPHDQESIAIWDDAVVKTELDIRPWVDINLGIWMYDFFGHDRAFCSMPPNTPIYAMDRRRRRSHQSYDATRTGHLPLVGELRAQLAAAALTPYNAALGRLSAVVDVTTIGGMPAIVSVIADHLRHRQDHSGAGHASSSTSAIVELDAV